MMRAHRKDIEELHEPHIMCYCSGVCPAAHSAFIPASKASSSTQLQSHSRAVLATRATLDALACVSCFPGPTRDETVSCLQTGPCM
jgi:hypothetical protein